MKQPIYDIDHDFDEDGDFDDEMLRDEEDDFEQDCPSCNATGQGDTPDTVCRRCKGWGVVSRN